MSTPANQLTARLLIEIPKRFPIILWRNNRIDAMVTGANGKMRRVSAGVNGQGDLSGIIGPFGKRLEIEVKVGKDRLSIAQKAFRNMIVSHGGVYIEARTLDECLEDLAACL